MSCPKKYDKRYANDKSDDRTIYFVAEPQASVSSKQHRQSASECEYDDRYPCALRFILPHPLHTTARNDRRCLGRLRMSSPTRQKKQKQAVAAASHKSSSKSSDNPGGL